MIPRIAWIHWAGKPMNWLRLQSIRTFRKHNPDWDIRVIGTPDNIRRYGLEYAHEADWTWWRKLHDEGGFLVASDVISIAPMRDEWLDGDLCAQVRGGDVYQFAALGAAPGNELMRRAEEACASVAPRLQGAKGDVYQAMGVNLLRRITCGEIERFADRLVDLPEEAFCFYDWAGDPFELWTESGPEKPLPAGAVGVHWYGGHVASRAREWGAQPYGPSWLERLARDS